MKFPLLTALLFFGFTTVSTAQRESPFHVNKKVTLPIIVGGAAASAYGYYKISQKPAITLEELRTLDERDLLEINQPATEQYSILARDAADVLFIGSYPLPFMLFANGAIRSDFGDIFLMYLETLSFVGTAYFLTAGHVDSYRPYVYNEDVPIGVRLENGGRNSFYGGHPTVTAASTMFIAQVVSAYYPGSRLRPWLYATGTGLTLASAFFRYESGKHFPTDLGIGLVYGFAVGLLVPHFHKKPVDGMSFYPVHQRISPGIMTKGVGLRLGF